MAINQHDWLVIKTVVDHKNPNVLEENWVMFQKTISNRFRNVMNGKMYYLSENINSEPSESATGILINMGTSNMSNADTKLSVKSLLYHD